MRDIGKAARVAAKQLAFASTEEKNRALLAAASALQRLSRRHSRRQ